MNILVVNTGSSSVKYGFFDTDRNRMRAEGLAERIGASRGTLRHRVHTEDGETREQKEDLVLPDVHAAMEHIVKRLDESARDGAAAGIAAVSHRVVHGGERFRDAVIVDDAVLAAIRDCSHLAPLHNPANLMGIEVARGHFPGVPQVAVFDTAFHQTMPPRAYRYAVPERLYRQYGVRRYGFHGTSHAWVAARTADVLGRPLESLDLITVHLGNGASMTAIKGGRCVETSMGMTPLEGLVMGTRSGDVDPALPAYLSRAAGLSIDEIDALLNRESGLYGLSGSNDMRDILRRRDAGEAGAALALDVYIHRIRKYIGAYYAVLGRLDALVFTAGIGEHAPEIRARSAEGLIGLGIRIEPTRNEARDSGDRRISPDDSPVTVLVIPTNEELAMALAARRLLEGRNR